MKRAARLLALLGAVAVGAFLFRAAPREVVLVYDLAGTPGARALEVVLRRDGELVRRARFEGPAAQVRHAVRLADGSYRLDFHLDAPGGPIDGQRAFAVSEPGTVVIALGP